jgi:hypothetical protein
MEITRLSYQAQQHDLSAILIILTIVGLLPRVGHHVYIRKSASKFLDTPCNFRLRQWSPEKLLVGRRRWTWSDGSTRLPLPRTMSFRFDGGLVDFAGKKAAADTVWWNKFEGFESLQSWARWDYNRMILQTDWRGLQWLQTGVADTVAQIRSPMLAVGMVVLELLSYTSCLRNMQESAAVLEPLAKTRSDTAVSCLASVERTVAAPVRMDKDLDSPCLSVNLAWVAAGSESVAVRTSHSLECWLRNL